MKAFLKRLADRSSPVRLIVLTLALTALWAFSGPDLFSPSPERGLTAEEAALYRRVRAAQDYLWQELLKRGVEYEPESDIDKTGLIGVEWSPITTTLGSLESKRNSCDPLWAVQALRLFDRLGLNGMELKSDGSPVSGDRIVVLSSSSFPGMLFSILAAAEIRGLETDLAVSLGSSTWGANRPEAPWTVLEEILREGGFLRTRPLFYTLGGGGAENGGGMFDDGAAILEAAALISGTELYRAPDLAALLRRKTDLIDAPSRPKARLVVNIGGSEANMGTDKAAISLPPGLLLPGTGLNAGNGVIGLALERGYPVLHLLNLRPLAERVGIDFKTRRSAFVPISGTSARRSPLIAAAGLFLFVFVLATHRRWTWAL